MMPKTAAGIAILLTLIIGMIVGQLHLVAGNRVITPPVSKQKSADPRMAAAFYESLNQLIRTGDASGVHAVVATGFVDNSPFLPEPGTTETLLRYFQGLHAAASGAVIQVEDVTADGALIAVRLQLVGVAGLTVAGLPVLSSSAKSYELLRIESDKVTERWASASLPALVESVGAFDIRFDANLLREPRLERVVLAPNAELSVNDHHGTILRVESGMLKFALLTPDATASAVHPDHDPVHPPANDDILNPGESVSIQPQRSFRIRNTGPEEASLVWLSIRNVDSQTSSTSSRKRRVGKRGDRGVVARRRRSDPVWARSIHARRGSHGGAVRNVDSPAYDR